MKRKLPNIIKNESTDKVKVKFITDTVKQVGGIDYATGKNDRL